MLMPAHLVEHMHLLKQHLHLLHLLPALLQLQVSLIQGALQAHVDVPNSDLQQNSICCEHFGSKPWKPVQAARVRSCNLVALPYRFLT